LQAIAINAGYELDTNPATPLGDAFGVLNATGDDATAAGIAFLVQFQLLAFC
jgi:hypothetical protein